MIGTLGLVGLVGLAGGLDLYLTMAGAVTLAALAPGDGPEGLADLSFPLLAAPAFAMVALEAWAERRPRLDLIWRQVHGIVRPVGAAALAALLLEDLPAGSRFAALTTTAGVAFLVHATRSGWALMARLRRPRPALGVSLLLEDALVLALVAGLWWAPGAALVAAGLVLAALSPRIPAMLAAFGLSFRLVAAHLRSLLERRWWRTPVHFPGWVKAQLAPSGVVTGGRLRGTPAACLGYPRPHSVRWGWLLVRGPRPIFAHRTRDGAEGVQLDAPADSEARSGPLSVCVPTRSTEGPDVLLVIPDDGPEAASVLAELTGLPHPANAGREDPSGL